MGRADEQTVRSVHNRGAATTRTRLLSPRDDAFHVVQVRLSAGSESGVPFGVSGGWCTLRARLSKKGGCEEP